VVEKAGDLVRWLHQRLVWGGQAGCDCIMHACWCGQMRCGWHAHAYAWIVCQPAACCLLTLRDVQQLQAFCTQLLSNLNAQADSARAQQRAASPRASQMTGLNACWFHAFITKFGLFKMRM